jgi:hypothetical protein
VAQRPADPVGAAGNDDDFSLNLHADKIARLRLTFKCNWKARSEHLALPLLPKSDTP